jgi:transcriptional regulator with XRE-family HTH domain
VHLVDDPNLVIGLNIRTARQNLGLSLSELALRANVSLKSLTLGEFGDHQFSADELYRLTSALGLKPTKLFRSP